MKQEDHIRQAYLRAVAVDYGRAFIGTPYKWGGNDPEEGFDCSGFVVEILQAVGILPVNTDFTADALLKVFREARVERGYAGCLAFWLNKDGEATHVMLLYDADLVIGAAGGGSSTTTAAAASRDNAFVKLRPLHYRAGEPFLVDPFKAVP